MKESRRAATVVAVSIESVGSDPGWDHPGPVEPARTVIACAAEIPARLP